MPGCEFIQLFHNLCLQPSLRFLINDAGSQLYSWQIILKQIKLFLSKLITYFSSPQGKSPFLLAITLILVLLLLAYLVAKIIMIKRKPSSNKHETNSLPDRSQLLKNFGLLLTLGVYGLIFFLVDKHYFALPPWACYGTGMVGHFLVHWAVLVLTLEFTVATVDYISLKGFREWKTCWHGKNWHLF